MSLSFATLKAAFQKWSGAVSLAGMRDFIGVSQVISRE
jgi:hypothetical protein